MDSQAISTSQASQAANSPVFSTNCHGESTVPLQAGGFQADNADSQAFSTSPQAINMPPQAVSNSQAGMYTFSNTSQAGRQVTSSSRPQTVSTYSQGASSGPWASNAASQTGGNVSQTGSTGSQGASTALPQANRQAARARGNNPQVSSRLPSQNRGNTLEDPNLKWVINLSRKPLIQAQKSVQAKGNNFVVSPRHPPNLGTSLP